MQNENDLYESPEEGEYHFSDEGGYDSASEEEGAKAPSITTTSSGAGAGFMAKYKRLIIAGGVFAGVLLVAFLIVSPPPTSAPNTDITATNLPPPSAPKPEMAKAPTPPAPAQEAVKPEPAKMETAAATREAAPSIAPAPVAASPAQPAPAAAPLPSPGTLTMAMETTPAPLNPTTIPEPTPGYTAQSMPPAPPMISAPVAPPLTPQQEARLSPESKMIVERLVSLEEENAKLINQLHNDYASKLASFEAQDQGVQDQIKTLNSRISSMESEMTQLLQTINKQQQENNGSSVVTSPSPPEGSPSFNLPPTSSITPATNRSGGYAVQAIIPGRAWLRASNGETVTVAEGDVLKRLGRVTKIDPYDGTIQIDTGHKVIVLTYGTGEAV